VRPSKALGQNFLTDPNLARAIAADAGAGPGVRAIDVGAGFGSVTVALAEAGAEVLAIEFDRALLPALHEVVDPLPGVEVLAADVLRLDWPVVLGEGERALAANLPYNIAVPLLLRMLEEAPQVSPYVVMVQRELGERLAAAPGSPAYGAVSAKVAYDAHVETLRRIPREVFWPRPKIESSVLRLTRRARPAGIDVDRRALFAVIDVAFGERRKTITNAVRRLGLDAPAAARVLGEAGVEAGARPEQLGLDAFARLAAALERAGAVGPG
jgi:16S rRNA (adenine1518-N6/adenine1519-N6)-dimethyltransferase